MLGHWFKAGEGAYFCIAYSELLELVTAEGSRGRVYLHTHKGIAIHR